VSPVTTTLMHHGHALGRIEYMRCRLLRSMFPWRGVFVRQSACLQTRMHPQKATGRSRFCLREETVGAKGHCVRLNGGRNFTQTVDKAFAILLWRLVFFNRVHYCPVISLRLYGQFITEWRVVVLIYACVFVCFVIFYGLVCLEPNCFRALCVHFSRL